MEVERGCVTRSHDTEMSAIERCHRGDLESLGRRNERGVDGSKRQVAIRPDELGYS
jgi:hypothetical protein